MTALDALVWAGAAVFALMALFTASLFAAVLADRRDRRCSQLEPPAWVNDGRPVLDDVQIDHWCRQLAESDDAAIWCDLKAER